MKYNIENREGVYYFHDKEGGHWLYTEAEFASKININQATLRKQRQRGSTKYKYIKILGNIYYY